MARATDSSGGTGSGARVAAAADSARAVPLLQSADSDRPILWAEGRVVRVGEFLASVRRVAAALAETDGGPTLGQRGGDAPQGGAVVNLCEHRDLFLIAYCAALASGRTTLLPPSRAPLVVEEVAARYAGSRRCDDEWVARAIARETPGHGAELGHRAELGHGAELRRRAEPGHGADGHAPPDRTAARRGSAEHIAAQRIAERIAPGHVAEIAFTSGSTGAPKAHVKRWPTLLGSTGFNAARIRECLASRHGAARPWIVATVPPQHMYGTETSVLLPLAGDMAVHAARPLFPADVAAALAEVPTPRVLVATPVHLRALVASGQRFPEVSVILSATAPLDRALAAAAEQALGAVMLEMFGSTETCVIATRRTAHEDAWHLYPGVSLTPSHDGALVDAPWFDAPTALQDIVELVGPDRFIVRGRNADMIEVAGKRASLADLTRRLLGIAGVRDAVVFQPDGGQTRAAELASPASAAALAAGPSRGDAAAAAVSADVARARVGPSSGQPVASGVVHRVAAFVVAPGLSAEAIHDELARAIDPAFLPRPLVLVPSLPRNELGKLTREALMRLTAEHLQHAGR